MNFTGTRSNLRTMGLLASFIAAILWIWLAFRGPDMEAGAFGSAASTKTALALTSDALLGPFPTSTVPTQTPSEIPTITSTIPTPTPTSTRTPTPTATFLPTATSRTHQPGATATGISTFAPTSVNPTRTSVPRTNTSIPRTNTSVPATRTSAPQPTDPPPPPPTTIIIPTIVIPIPTIPLIQTLLP